MILFTVSTSFIARQPPNASDRPENSHSLFQCLAAQQRVRLELGKACDDLHHHAATGRGGVNRLSQAAKAGLHLGNFLPQAQQTFHDDGQGIKLDAVVAVLKLG